MDAVNEGVGYLPHTYWTVSRDSAEPTEGGVIEEAQITVRVNGHHIASMMCSPLDEQALALGFLYNEGMIETIAQVEGVEFDLETRCLNVILPRRNVHIRRHMIMTSGCGGGVTFHEVNKLRHGVETDFVTVPDVIFVRMRDLKSAAVLYNQVRGVHTSLLGTADAPLYSAEDVGRHNTVDKIAGKALQDDYDMRECVLLTSGRVSSEMISKANRMNIPVVASRTAPTSTSVQLAEQWDICLIGYVRQDTMRVYTHPERLGLG
jgi:FdhD protein